MEIIVLTYVYLAPLSSFDYALDAIAFEVMYRSTLVSCHSFQNSGRKEYYSLITGSQMDHMSLCFQRLELPEIPEIC